MGRIYLTGSGPNRGYHTGSGILSFPPKLQLRDKDHHTGTYPTMARTGDPDFTGVYDSTFDDTNTILFESGQITYPLGLPTSSNFISGNIVTPNFLNGLVAAGTSSAGIADAHVLFVSGQNITPFDESRTYLDNNSTFYATGTSSGTLPGFNQRLSSKTSIVISTNPSVATDFFFSTGTLPSASGSAGGVNTGLGYYNWPEKRWEIIGDLSSGSNIDILNSDPAVRQEGLLGFVPANLRNIPSENMEALTGSSGQAILETIGFPMSEYGFPFASKYDATGSQMLDMSDYLTAPFLLEKIVIEFSGAIGPHIIADDRFGPAVKSFFLMTQKNMSGSIDTFSTAILSSSNPGALISRTYSHGFAKSLISFGMVSLTYDGLPSAFSRDLDLVVPGTGIRRTDTTGSYRVEFESRVAQKNDFGGLTSFSKTDREATPDRAVLKIEGSRHGFGLSDGRSFIAGAGGLKPTGSFSFAQLHPAGSGDNLVVTVSDSGTIAPTSPVILLPTDKLVLGFSNTPNYWPNYAFAHSVVNPITTRYEAGLAQSNVVLSPGKGKLMLYGSMLRNNLPVEPTMNQPLTSDAIHEDLHYDNPIYDQWDVEPTIALTGSYVDLIITGSMLVSPLGDPDAFNVRRVQGSVAGGQAGTTGSLQRFVRLSDSGGKIYDSYPPNAIDVITSVGSGFYDLSNSYFLSVGTPDQSSIRGSDNDWYMRPAYEISSSRFVKQNYGSFLSLAYNSSDVATAKPVFLTYPDSLFVVSDSGAPFGIVTDVEGILSGSEARKNQVKTLFGFGMEQYGAPSSALAKVSPGGLYVTPIIRGYKYGLAGLFGSSLDARFRRDKFGQFRDMLEQRKQPAVLGRGQTVDYPVFVVFVSREGELTTPSNTHSQNLSPHATSSFPYYDGLTKDRSDNPDIVLTPVSVKAT